MEIEKPAAIISTAAAVFGVGLYFHEAPSRQEARDTLAWQVLALKSDRAGNGGQKWALEVLAKDSVSLHGIRAKKADLSGDLQLPESSTEKDPTALQLSGAKLHWAIFYRSNLGRAVFAGAKLSHANFRCAAVAHADFSGSDLEGALFDMTDLTGADFTGANVSEVSFSGSCVNLNQQPVGLGKTFPPCKPWPKDGFGGCDFPDPDQ
jgi:hypothetical protein